MLLFYKISKAIKARLQRRSLIGKSEVFYYDFANEIYIHSLSNTFNTGLLFEKGFSVIGVMNWLQWADKEINDHTKNHLTIAYERLEQSFLITDFDIDYLLTMLESRPFNTVNPPVITGIRRFKAQIGKNAHRYKHHPLLPLVTDKKMLLYVLFTIYSIHTTSLR